MKPVVFGGYSGISVAGCYVFTSDDSSVFYLTGSSVVLLSAVRNLTMWKFLEGVKPPEKKVKLSDADRNERQRLYDRERRNRGFLTGWKEKMNWLV